MNDVISELSYKLLIVLTKVKIVLTNSLLPAKQFFVDHVVE
jgi:hypothetical protein